MLLIGATGVFGTRLAQLLARKQDVQLILAARSLPALVALQTSLAAEGLSAGVAVVDRLKPNLMTLRPWLVIDAAGPFQDSGYDLALATVQAGAHYIDLADARGFVAGFRKAVDAAARQAGVLAVTGASSTPALSHAALESLTSGWRGLDEVVVLISPGARAPSGLAVIEAILSYVGQPVRVFQNYEWQVTPGWSFVRRLSMPALGHRWGYLCDTPDLDLLPERFTIRRSALFLASLELAPMHLGLALLGLMVQCKILPNLRPLARPLKAMADRLSALGSDRGGMVVQAYGDDAEGRLIHARWALWAEANSGPFTPTSPASALVSALLDGRVTLQGAATSAGLLELDVMLSELANLPIYTCIDEGSPQDPILFRRLLGRRSEALPPSLRRVHEVSQARAFAGHGVSRLGTSLVARALRPILGLPRSGRSDVQVQITPTRSGETWTRRFGDTQFSSRLIDIGRLGQFEERFGPLGFRFRLQPTSRGVLWQMTGWSVLGAALPLRFGPKMHARADQVADRYRFRVAVGHPWIGFLFAYRGTLDPWGVAEATS